ncbi:serine hydrolase domain-containing protein [Solimonas flava]|uniref:serine hydrolase domain-containing protein n=1 Tax=Solimonas flava TaxID=415849 RepID=UPI00041B72FC|nr:serine hydrolase domain-containing protein [Solimonas flava]
MKRSAPGALLCAALLAGCAGAPAVVQAPPTDLATAQRDIAAIKAAPLKPGSGHDVRDAAAFRYENLHAPMFTPSARIARGGPVSTLPFALRPEIGRTPVQTRLGAMTVDRFVDAFPMDGVLMIQHGRVVYERYPRMRADDLHQLYSVSKLVIALLVAELVDAGRVEPQLGIEHYVPALADSDWAGVSVQNILDMASGMQKTGLEEEAWEAEFWASAYGRLPPSPYALIAAMRRDPALPQGADFEYATRNTFVLAWLLESVWRQPLAEIVSARLWQRIGADHDAYMGISPSGAPHTEFSMTLRDLGRLGMLYTPSAANISVPALVSKATLRRMQRGGRPELLRGIEHEQNARGFDGEAVDHNGWQWDAVFADGTLWKSGYAGQGLLVSPAHDLVIAFFSSWPAMDRQDYNRFQGVARQLIRAGVFGAPDAPSPT